MSGECDLMDEMYSKKDRTQIVTNYFWRKTDKMRDEKGYKLCSRKHNKYLRLIYWKKLTVEGKL